MTIRRMRIAYLISTRMATHTHSQYAILISFHHNHGSTKAPRCDVTRKLPILSIKQCSLRLLKFVSIITTIKNLNVCLPRFVHTCNAYDSFFMCNELWKQIPT
jgi:hypothetical protein